MRRTTPRRQGVEFMEVATKDYTVIPEFGFHFDSGSRPLSWHARPAPSPAPVPTEAVAEHKSGMYAPLNGAFGPGSDGQLRAYPLPLPGGLVFEFPFVIRDFVGRQSYIVAELQFEFSIGHLRMELNRQISGQVSQPLQSFSSPSAHTLPQAQMFAWTSTKYADISANINSIRMPLPPGKYMLSVGVRAHSAKCVPNSVRAFQFPSRRRHRAAFLNRAADSALPDIRR